MRTMAMLVGCILLLPSAQAGDREGPDDWLEARVEELLEYLEDEDGEIVEEILEIVNDLIGNSAVCIGSSVSLSDGYIDHAYHQELVSGGYSSSGPLTSVRTTPTGSGAWGFVLVVGTSGGCEEYYHEGDEGFVVGG